MVHSDMDGVGPAPGESAPASAVENGSEASFGSDGRV